jgi:ribonuclease BN (tRNA processing enzyme)
MDYITIKPGEPLKVGSATITPIVLSHPVLNFGYRIDCDGQSIFFTGDYEPQLNIYAPEDDEYCEFQSFVDEKWAEVVHAMTDVDALIIDSSYTNEEYAFKQGWGHGTYDSGIKLATAAKAKKLFFTHHEPTRSDANLETIFQNLLQNNPDINCKLFLAQEGVDISL